MWSRCRSGVATGIVIVVILSVRVEAQEHVTLRTDVMLYGDNTEFHNPFREGETIFGSALRLAADIDLTAHVTLSLGGFGNLRFGSEKAFEQGRPIVALTARGKHSTFVFGTLPPVQLAVPTGPDRMGPHGLLPPIQRETLTFDRPYEAGLEWTLRTLPLRHTLWLSWQRLNTPQHRERFDTGLEGEVRLVHLVSLPFQAHVVHQGGQLFASGPVADSGAVAGGVTIGGPFRRLDKWTIELFGLGSRFVPDRSRPDLSRDGVGFFGRAAAELDGWRGHILFWRGRNFIAEEGDPNYQSVTLAGARYRGTRDYAEAGLARSFRLAPGAVFEVSGRLHRTEGYYEYSYRIVSVISLAWPLR
jgi:hypothetical protein